MTGELIRTGPVGRVSTTDLASEREFARGTSVAQRRRVNIQSERAAFPEQEDGPLRAREASPTEPFLERFPIFGYGHLSRGLGA